jgi:hypothetical protein
LHAEHGELLGDRDLPQKLTANPVAVHEFFCGWPDLGANGEKHQPQKISCSESIKRESCGVFSARYFMSDDASAIERFFSVAIGALLLLIATSLFGWDARLIAAGLRSDAGWPPGLGQLLLPVGATAAVVGFGAWRLLLMGLPARIGGYSLGRVLLAAFGLAAVIGAVI